MTDADNRGRLNLEPNDEFACLGQARAYDLSCWRL